MRNQGWKDSDDAVHHADGRLAEGSIALCEVQAYAYGARRALAAIEQRCGHPEAAERLQEEARDLRRRFHAAFWSDAIGTYALAIDGAGEPCVVRTSNAGHCLWTGIASRPAAAAIARQLLAPTSFNGWGVRTLDEREVRYNPMSYHNGSVWPHDNALIGLGLARYGHSSEAMRIFTGLFDTACAMPQYRLPELFCGFPARRGGAHPLSGGLQSPGLGQRLGVRSAGGDHRDGHRPRGDHGPGAGALPQPRAAQGH
ncbi:amylo-alpha-1,6-glucosidase [Cyanobium sp. ATX-6F1]|uniref:amylo-alpha-1,6-glucosidase n=1 Tax=Cyanobium sp. ATX-6F1 TaxID=3137388 RepID=UPI0039BE21B6